MPTSPSSSTCFLGNTHGSENDQLFPPIIDIGELLSSNENSPCTTPLTNFLSNGSDTNLNSKPARIQLPPISIGVKIRFDVSVISLNCYVIVQFEISKKFIFILRTLESNIKTYNLTFYYFWKFAAPVYR